MLVDFIRGDMLVNFSIIVVLALLMSKGVEKIKLPGLLGMIFVGILMGPYGFDLINPTITEVSGELRTLALIVILLRAGLGIKRDTLNQIGTTALKLSCIPGLCEGFLIMTVAHFLLALPWAEAGMLGFIIAAVSPAVVVPSMLNLKEERWGENKQIPTLILAGASIDDVFAITLFTSFLGMGIGEKVNLVKQIGWIPISIILGILVGFILGLGLVWFFKKYHIRDTKKVLILLALSIVFYSTEDYIHIATLLGIMAIGFVLLEKSPIQANRLSAKMNKVWVGAEILLFVLIGAQVNVPKAWEAGGIGLLIIVIGLLGRSIGVIISTAGSDLNKKERLFCVIAYWPKATVQAAIGAVPLMRGVNSGAIILAIAVLSIIITAPIGAFGIKWSGPRLLKRG